MCDPAAGSAPLRIGAAFQVAQQSPRGYSSISPLDNDRDFPPIDLDIEINPEPAAVTHVRWPEEALWIRLDKHVLRPLRRRAPSAKPVVVMMVGCGDEQP